MKSYPKVWRYDHPLIDSLVDTGSLHLSEKLDGGNFRFALYDERFADEYESWDFQDVTPTDGDLVFGTKQRVRGRIDDPLESVNGSLWRAIRHLREELDPAAIRTIHDDYGPLVFYAENMVLHSIEYNWEETPPLIGFDVYASRQDSGTDTDRFAGAGAKTFEGFLPVPTVYTLFDELGIETTPAIASALDASDFDPATFEIPQSQWRDGAAEGVVIRNLDTGERGKIVTEEAREANTQRWGKDKAEAEDDTELLVATYCTNARIRKMVHKLVVDEGHEFSRDLIEPLHRRVVHDIWDEEWADIIRQNWTIEMNRVWPLVAKRCVEVVDWMTVNARINDAPPEKLWTDYQDT